MLRNKQGVIAGWSTVLATLVVFAGCSDANGPLTEGPLFDIVGNADACASTAVEPGMFKLIKTGGSGTFHVLATAGTEDGPIVEDKEVSLDAGDCAVVHVNTAPFPDINFVRVTETSGDPAVVECEAIHLGEPAVCDEVTENSVLYWVAKGKGAVATFTNEPDMVLGRMTGGGTVRLQEIGGETVRITHGFTLHCDIELSNNLEINWDGNQWHLEKESLENVSCTDEPEIAPEPPAAPFDTFRASAIGRYNGVPGFEIAFTLQDAGEPGGRGDKAGMTIVAPNGDVVLDVPFDFTVGGNLQAHYDQPHGSNVNR